MEKIEHINYIKAPIATVYKALTTQGGLSAIWTEELIVKPELGFINEFNFGDNDNTKMKVIELVQNQRVLWECLDSDPEWVGTKISFDLIEKNGITSIVLKHFDKESLHHLRNSFLDLIKT